MGNEPTEKETTKKVVELIDIVMAIVLKLEKRVDELDGEICKLKQK